MLLAASSRQGIKPKAQYFNFFTRKSNSYVNIEKGALGALF
jgi:hypothetical protein